MGATVATILPATVEHYRKNGVISNLCFTPDKMLTPMWAAIARAKKQTGFDRGHIVPIKTGRGDAVGPDFSIQQARSQSTDTGSAAAYDRFVVTAPSDDIHGFATFTRRAISEANNSGNPTVIRKLITDEIDDRIELIRQRLVFAAAGAGYGRAATIIAAPTASPHTVTIHSSCASRIAINEKFTAGQYETTGALRSATALTVTGKVVDIAAKTCVLTLSASPVALSWANGDTLFYYGYRHNDASPNRLMPAGAGAWLPFAAATDTLFGVARTGRPDLYGQVQNCASFPSIRAALLECGNSMVSAGFPPDACFINTDSFTAMINSKEDVKLNDITAKIGPYAIGFDGVSIQLNSGKVPIIPDLTLESGQFRMGPWNSEKDAPYMVMPDGLDIINIDDYAGKIQQLASSAGFEVRLWSEVQFVFPSPVKYLAGYGLPST